MFNDTKSIHQFFSILEHDDIYKGTLLNIREIGINHVNVFVSNNSLRHSGYITCSAKQNKVFSEKKMH